MVTTSPALNSPLTLPLTGTSAAPASAPLTTSSPATLVITSLVVLSFGGVMSVARVTSTSVAVLPALSLTVALKL